MSQKNEPAAGRGNGLKIDSDQPSISSTGAGSQYLSAFGFISRAQIALVRSGMLSRLNGSELRVLVVLLSHADGGGECYPSVATIARLSGLQRRAVYLALSGLQRRGLVQAELPGRGRNPASDGRPSRFRVAHPDSPIWATGNAQPDAQFGDEEAQPDAQLHGNAQSDARICAKKRPGNAQQDAHAIRKKISKEGIHEAAAPPAGPAAADPAAAVRAALAEAGIGEPTRSELARSGLTADQVRHVVASGRAGGKGTGAIVENLRALAAAKRAEAEAVGQKVDAHRREMAIRRAHADNPKVLSAAIDAVRPSLRAVGVDPPPLPIGMYAVVASPRAVDLVYSELERQQRTP